jgi:AcrR family transcriptional regulator
VSTPKRGRPRLLSVEQVVDSAVAVATRHGAESVTMRSVAAELNVNPMTLYSYVADAEDLRRRAAEGMLGELTPPGLNRRRPVRSQLLDAYVALRSHYVAHPRFITAAGTDNQLAPGAWQWHEDVYALYAHAGVPDEVATRTHSVLCSTAIVSAMVETNVAERGRTTEEERQEQRHTLEDLPAEDFPHLHRILSTSRMHVSGEAGFVLNVRAVLERLDETT